MSSLRPCLRRERMESGHHLGAAVVELCLRCLRQQQQIYNKLGPYFNPTYTRTGWIGQPPVLDRHEVVTIGGDVVTLRQATP